MWQNTNALQIGHMRSIPRGASRENDNFLTVKKEGKLSHDATGQIYLIVQCPP